MTPRIPYAHQPLSPPPRGIPWRLDGKQFVANVAGGVIRVERDGGHYEVRLGERVLARERGRAAAMNAAERVWGRGAEP